MSKMDSLFLIGDSHKVCQDYCLTGELILAGETVEYMIVADGCSSSKDSDLGARILALVARRKLIHALEGKYDLIQCYYKFGTQVIRAARDLAAELEVEESCLDATLLLTYKYKDNIYTYFYGDGNYIIRDTMGDLIIYNVRFESGAPFYLNYWDNQFRHACYKEEFPGKVIITKTEKDRVVQFENKDSDKIILFCETVDNAQMVAISTDGIESFTNKTCPLTINDLKDGLFQFKNTNGEFLKRRVERHVSDLHKDSIVHHDDLGIAAMLLENV